MGANTASQIEAQSSLQRSLLKNGFAVVRSVFNSHQITALIEALERDGESESFRKRGAVFAVRNLLDVSPEIKALAASACVRALVTPALGEKAFPVRGILFDKTPDANWKVPWHQDVTIAVARQLEVPGFGPWSMKAGVLHVQPPAEILENMLSVRIHLDPCGEENGALKVMSGSHLCGRVSESEASRMGMEGPVEVCDAETGDVLLMRPLLLHASSASTTPKHRRVIHIDYAAQHLPEGLAWAVESDLN